MIRVKGYSFGARDLDLENDKNNVEGGDTHGLY
jgi:hypothetical protein